MAPGNFSVIHFLFANDVVVSEAAAAAEERGGGTSTEQWHMGNSPYGVILLGYFVSIARHGNLPLADERFEQSTRFLIHLTPLETVSDRSSSLSL